MYSCKAHPIDLLNTFDIDVQQDQVSIHPQYFCQACKGVIYHHKTKGVVLHSVITWKPHDKAACETCGRADRAKMGGRHSKIHIGRLAVMGKRSFLSHVLHVAPPSHLCQQQGTVTHSLLKFTTPAQYPVSLQEVTCCICSSVLNQPVQLRGYVSLVCANRRLPHKS